MKFRKKPIIIEATQWFKNGDHPKDNTFWVNGDAIGKFLSEGSVVRYFRRPDVPGHTKCKICGELMHKHGRVATLEGGHTVCPGDWIITGVKGEYYPCKPDIFEATYENVWRKE